MDFASLLRRSWELFVTEIVQLVLFTALGLLLCLTLVLIPTVTGGWVRGILAYVREGRRPAFEELWSFDDYLPILGMLLLGGLAISVGYALLIVPGVILSVWWLYALYFLLDREMGVIEAFGASKDAVGRNGFGDHLVLLLILFLLSVLGGALSGLGSLLTTPFGFVLVSFAYLDLDGGDPAPAGFPRD